MATNKAQMSAQQMQQQNFLQRNAVVANSIKMKQQIYSKSVDPASESTINISTNIRNAGLLLGFIVTVEAGLTNGSTTAATRTPFGVANLVKEFRFDDLSNYTRIQCPGWYLAMLNSVRARRLFGGAYDGQLPIGFGNNYSVYSGPSSLAADATGTAKMQYFVPISYSGTDLRGAMYMSTVSATTNLQINLNTTPFTDTGNPISYLYTGNSGGGYTGNVTVTVYQIYLDQIPRAQDGSPILPMQDLNTVYDIKQTTFSTPTANQDFPMPYSNFRSFLSTLAVFDNGGTYNTGSDVAYWALQSANFTNIFKLPPDIVALEGRTAIMGDFPDGCYFFESRDTPINTINFGNMELLLNASTVNSNARVLVGYESFALVNQVAGATSLGAG